MDVDYVIPLHCSGEVFYDLAKSEIPTKLLRSYTGTRFVFEGQAAGAPRQWCIAVRIPSDLARLSQKLVLVRQWLICSVQHSNQSSMHLASASKRFNVCSEGFEPKSRATRTRGSPSPPRGRSQASDDKQWNRRGRFLFINRNNSELDREKNEPVRASGSLSLFAWGTCGKLKKRIDDFSGTSEIVTEEYLVRTHRAPEVTVDIRLLLLRASCVTGRLIFWREPQVMH